MFFKYCAEIDKWPMPSYKVVEAYNQLRFDCGRLADLKAGIDDIDQEIVLVSARKKRTVDFSNLKMV